MRSVVISPFTDAQGSSHFVFAEAFTPDDELNMTEFRLRGRTESRRLYYLETHKGDALACLAIIT
jgi:hypothetical protein